MTIWIHTRLMPMILTLAIGLVACGKGPPPPPKLQALAPFALIDHDGRPFGSKQLAGRVWIGNFIFTSCPSVCPVVTKAMRVIQDEATKRDLPVALITFTVDPVTDTPAVLKAYAQKTGVDFKRWRFLTAKDAATMRETVEGNFKTAVGKKKINSAGVYDIAHTTKLVLVGPGGALRGYFSSDQEGITDALKAARAIVKHEIE